MPEEAAVSTHHWGYCPAQNRYQPHIRKRTMPRPKRRRATLRTGRPSERLPRRKFRTNQPTEQKLSRPKGQKSRPFKAKFHGQCPACFEVWDPGDRIQRCGQFYYHAACVK